MYVFFISSSSIIKYLFFYLHPIDLVRIVAVTIYRLVDDPVPDEELPEDLDEEELEALEDLEVFEDPLDPDVLLIGGV